MVTMTHNKHGYDTVSTEFTVVMLMYTYLFTIVQECFMC